MLEVFEDLLHDYYDASSDINAAGFWRDIEAVRTARAKVVDAYTAQLDAATALRAELELARGRVNVNEFSLAAEVELLRSRSEDWADAHLRAENVALVRERDGLRAALQEINRILSNLADLDRMVPGSRYAAHVIDAREEARAALAATYQEANMNEGLDVHVELRRVTAERDALREQNAALRAELAAARKAQALAEALVISHEGHIAKLEAERDALQATLGGPCKTWKPIDGLGGQERCDG
jgi:chromosome segregation ATPase